LFVEPLDRDAIQFGKIIVQDTPADESAELAAAGDLTMGAVAVILR